MVEGISIVKIVHPQNSSIKLRKDENHVIVLPINLLMGAVHAGFLGCMTHYRMSCIKS